MNLEEYSYDHLCEMREAFKQEIDRLRKSVWEVEAEVKQRMVMDDAAVFDTENWKGKLVIGQPSVSNPLELRARLVEAVGRLGLNIFHPQKPESPRVDHRKLKELAKLGNPAKEIISEFVVRGEETLQVERKT